MGWVWTAASARGTSHERTGSPLQDAYACFAPRHAAGPLVAIISDGAGSARFGGKGAALVCRTLTLRAREFFAAGSEGLPRDDDIEEWVDDARDLITAVAYRRELAPREFAATLICVISNGKESVIAHVGDGCVVFREAVTEVWIAPSWPDYGEYASTTYFVTDERLLRLRISRINTEISAIAAFSDGIERLALDLSAKRPFERFFDAVMRPVTTSRATGRDARLSAELKRYLSSAQVNARTDDDKTLILAARR